MKFNKIDDITDISISSSFMYRSTQGRVATSRSIARINAVWRYNEGTSVSISWANVRKDWWRVVIVTKSSFLTLLVLITLSVVVFQSLVRTVAKLLSYQEKISKSIWKIIALHISYRVLSKMLVAVLRYIFLLLNNLNLLFKNIFIFPFFFFFCLD